MINKNNPPADALQHNLEMYNDYYKKPSWWFQFRYDTQVKRKTCLRLLKSAQKGLKNQRVFEIGFGSGAVIFSFDTSCELYGVEISHSAIEQASLKARVRGYRKYEFKLAADEILPYQDGAFDVVIASHVIEHVADDDRLLSEIRRVLSTNGVAIVLIPINESYDDPNHLHRYTGSRFIELAEEQGFLVKQQLENELLFHLVEKFYFEAYNYRWRILGPLIAVLFNFPTAILPFWAYRMAERGMMLMGLKPRQFGCVLVRNDFSGEK